MLKVGVPKVNLEEKHTTVVAKSANRKVELMAPVGSFAAMQAAIDEGANSIYFGIEQLNMRARATMNFAFDDLKEIATRCNEAGVRTYLTLNTILYNHDLKIMRKVVDAVKENNITAVIAADLAVIQYAFEQKVEVHISTQQNITNIETVKFFANFADVMVLSRELSLNQIKSICDDIKEQKISGPSGNLIEIEVFAHGALCMAVSGKCYLSLHTANASANRGACVQNCRRKYTVTDEEGNQLEIDNEYIMSPKDLCTIDFLDKLIEAGVSVLKLEGRGKGPEYTAMISYCYRQAIDSVLDGSYNEEKVKAWLDILSGVYNRGFWGGYYLGKKLGDWTNKPGSSAKTKKIYLGKIRHYYDKAQVGEFYIETNSLEKNDEVLIIGPTTGVLRMLASDFMVDDSYATSATKGQVFTMKVPKKIRISDKIFKVVVNQEAIKVG